MRALVIVEWIAAALLVGAAVLVCVVQPDGWVRTAVVDVVLAAVVAAAAVFQSRRDPSS